MRIALAFTTAFVVAELLRLDLQLTFVAPLVAGMLASNPAVSASRLAALPIVAWLLVAGTGVALQLLAGEPIVLCLLSLWVFHAGFKMFEQPRTTTLGLLLLVVFAIVPQTLIKAPELSADLPYWFGMNFGIAAASEWVTRRALPDPGLIEGPPRLPQLPPLIAAAALQLGVILTATMQPPAPGAVMIGVIIVLRADRETATNVIRDRFVAALLGGATAVVVWEMLWLAPSLPILATLTLLAAWPFARRVAAGGPGASVAMKSLNVLAILLGEGFSVFYEDADDRIWTRLAGVVIGLTYAALVLSLTRRFTARPHDDASALWRLDEAGGTAAGARVHH